MTPSRSEVIPSGDRLSFFRGVSRGQENLSLKHSARFLLAFRGGTVRLVAAAQARSSRPQDGGLGDRAANLHPVFTC